MRCACVPHRYSQLAVARGALAKVIQSNSMINLTYILAPLSCFGSGELRQARRRLGGHCEGAVQDA